MKPNYELKPAMEKLGIKQLRSHQLKPIQSLKGGEDTIVIAGTSSGKSMIYQIPGLLHKKKLTLVLEPTLSLIYNQVQDLQDHGVKVDYLDHFRTKEDVQKIYEKIRQQDLTFLYVTPERLRSKEFIEVMEDVWIDILVIDECHCMVEWGYTFREAYLKIGKFLDKLPNRPTICACSATLTEKESEGNPEPSGCARSEGLSERSETRESEHAQERCDGKGKETGETFEEAFRLERDRIRKLTKCTSWTEQLAKFLSQQEEVVDKFLHRIYQDIEEIVSLDELIHHIENSRFQKKTKERMIRLAKKISDCESIAVAQKRLKMKNKDVIKLLKKFRDMGLNSVCW